MIEIIHRYTKAVLYKHAGPTIKDAVEAAVKESADFRYADLRSADLRSADLTSADLRYADLTSADLRYADLTSADFRYADLTSADLRYADLRYADLTSAQNLRLPTGELFSEYLTTTLPALLTAGGKTLESFENHWKCHDWNNCPMAHAFDVKMENDTPILLRHHVSQFVMLFDAQQIPWEAVQTLIDAKKPNDTVERGEAR